MSHAVMASSGSKSAGGARKGRCTTADPCFEAASISELRIGQATAWLDDNPVLFLKFAHIDTERQPSEVTLWVDDEDGIPASAASSMSALAMTVFPDPVDPSMAP